MSRLKSLFNANSWYENVGEMVVEFIVLNKEWSQRNLLEDVETRLNEIYNSFFYFCNIEPFDKNDPKYVHLLRKYANIKSSIDEVRGNPIKAFWLLLIIEGFIRHENGSGDSAKGSGGQKSKGNPLGGSSEYASDEEVNEAFSGLLKSEGIYSLMNAAMFGGDRFKNLLEEMDRMPIDMDMVLKVSALLVKSKNLKEVLEICGQIEAVSHNRRMGKVMSDHAEGETKGIKFNSDVKNMTASQMSEMIHNPSAFRANLSKGSLETKHQRGLAKTRRGPVIVIVDESGSMLGEPENWAKAILLNISKEAILQKRKLAIIPFSDTARGPNLYSSNNFDYESFINDNLLRSSDGYGTDFSSALKVAADMNQVKRGWDIIFITDGQDASNYISFERELNRVRSYNSRILGVSIDGRVTDRLREMSNEVLYVSSKDRNALAQKADSIIKWLEESRKIEI